MVRRLILCFLIPITVGYSQSSNLSIDGYYQGLNLYVSNPYQSDGFGFCISKVLVNGNVLPATIQNEHFQIDLSLFGLTKGDELFVELEHYAGCTPRFINPEVLLPKSTFVLASLTAATNGSISWSTKSEAGRLPFLVEQYKWGRWVSAGEIQGNGSPGLNQYRLDIIPHSGYNKVRIVQIDNTLKDIIYFSSDSKPAKTKFELYDAFGNLLKKGFDSQIDCKQLLNGIYFINFDNSSEKFIKY
jgi:hypothetical protein